MKNDRSRRIRSFDKRGADFTKVSQLGKGRFSRLFHDITTLFEQLTNALGLTRKQLEGKTVKFCRKN
ncbi:hypothetical protein B1690_12430 [Geobacillus sp. 46C-IIa]|nr:hypothetical protein B1690_12430 [Geobacillus sp. 46C-IIa]